MVSGGWSTNPLRRVAWAVAGAAAVAVLPYAADVALRRRFHDSFTIIFWGSRTTEHTTGDLERRTFALGKGIDVELAPNSRLRHSEAVRGDVLGAAPVSLEGAATFTVAADSLWPFLLHTGVARIKAMTGTEGTTFVVQAFRGEPMAEITLVSGGPVEIRLPDGHVGIWLTREGGGRARVWRGGAVEFWTNRGWSEATRLN